MSKQVQEPDLIPIVETPRLRLRPHRADDYAASATMWGDARVTRHIGGRPSTPEESWQRLLRYGGLWPLLGFGYWVVEQKATGRFAGEVGFADFHRAIDPPFGDVPEMGWVLAPDAHGKGYATEAVRAALAWAEANLRGSRIVCMIDPGNAASLRVAEKTGFREYARASFRDQPTVLLERSFESRGDAEAGEAPKK